ncbi:iron chaperone [Ohtaekwangia kribbensis]|jgi:uncharacterized protein YdhG (YjbR/CyaY superfamily)|uniref:Iron chaperone n=1 Tax=Ohtaekwangia kribbensis TaxID=688913 RepID=A0ABW3KB05_9BACT
MENTKNITKFTGIDEYIAAFPADVQKLLESIRGTIRKAAPKAEETIKYAMPTFILNGNLIHFAAYKNHIGIYPVPRGDDSFKKLLVRYEGDKSTMRIPLHEPLPLTLIGKIVKYNVKRNQDALKVKK